MLKIKYKPPLQTTKENLTNFIQAPVISIVILQQKRVIAPYIFCKYIYPIFKRSYSGRIDFHIVQHISDFSQPVEFSKSTLIPKECLKIVQSWTQRGLFSGAKITTHSQNLVSYPSIPSLLKSFKLVDSHDLCLHLHDDSLVLDRGIDKWDEFMSDFELGTYGMESFGDVYYSKSSNMLSRRSFRKNILSKYSKLSKWRGEAMQSFRNRLEIRMSNLVSQKIKEIECLSFKGSIPAIQCHQDYLDYKKDYLSNIKEFLQQNEISYLDSDFGIFDRDYIY